MALNKKLIFKCRPSLSILIDVSSSVGVLLGHYVNFDLLFGSSILFVINLVCATHYGEDLKKTERFLPRRDMRSWKMNKINQVIALARRGLQLSQQECMCAYMRPHAMNEEKDEVFD